MIPSVFVTAAHYRAGLKRDAASVWIEDVTQSSFKVCLRESSNRNWEKLEFFFFFNWKSNQLNRDPDKRLLHENSYL